jgi:hypothetical protein
MPLTGVIWGVWQRWTIPPSLFLARAVWLPRSFGIWHLAFAIDPSAFHDLIARVPSSFFPMSRGDRWYLAGLVLVAIVAFLPVSRATEVGPLPLFAWLMAGLMVAAPLVALVRLLSDRPSRAGGDGRR